jgi:hypothetical protein
MRFDRRNRGWTSFKLDKEDEFIEKQKCEKTLVVRKMTPEERELRNRTRG